MSSDKPVPTNSRKAMKFRGNTCLNCGHPLDLSDRYCPYCSQLNSTKSLSLKDFLGEFIGSIITYDSRFRYTLKDLLFKPGTITRKYVGGKRLRYANPFRFYLSVSIIYFLLQSLIGAFTGGNPLIDETTNEDGTTFRLGPGGDNVEIMSTLPDSLAEVKGPSFTGAVLDSIIRQQARENDINPQKLDSVLQANDIDLTQENIDSVMQQVNSIPFLSRLGESDEEPDYTLISEAALDTMNWAERGVKRAWLYRDFYKTTEINNPVVALDSLNHENNAYNRWIYSKNESVERIIENPSAFAEYLLEKIPFFIFFFTPVFALFFWLLYYYKHYTYMEHMIFIFHVFSFVFLAGLICLIPDTLIGNDVFFGIVMAFVGPFYFYKALRNFYQENRVLTVIKFVLLNFFFVIGATIGAVIFFAFSAAMY